MGKYEAPEYTQYSSDYPVAINIHGDLFLIDGHHRVALAKKDGLTSIRVAVKNIDV